MCFPKNGVAGLFACWLAQLAVCLQWDHAARFPNSVAKGLAAALPGACRYQDDLEGLLLQTQAFTTPVAYASLTNGRRLSVVL